MRKLAALRYLSRVLLLVDDIRDSTGADPTNPAVWNAIEAIIERRMMRRQL